MSFKETEVGRIPQEWELYELKDKANITMGQSPRSEFYNNNREGIPFMQGRTTFGDKYHTIDTWCTDPKKYAKQNDVLISVRAPVGDVNIATTDLCIGRGLASLSMENRNNEFLYYLLKNYTNLIMSKVSGTVFSSINKVSIETLRLPFPNDEEQKAIAKILSDLDNKIEVNNKINKRLEDMAQSIFKHWFVDFEFPNEEGKPYKSSGGEMIESELGMIPKGWEVINLGKVLNTIEAGNRPKGGVGNLTDGIPSIGAENIIGLGKYDYSKEKYVTNEYFEKMQKGIVKSRDVLLYKDGAQLGRKTFFMDEFPHEKCCINSHVFILRSNEIISQEYLYLWLDQYHMTESIKNLNANSAQPGINQAQVKTLDILIPNKEIIMKFNQIIEILFKQIFSYCKSNKNLSDLRDTLLPKLMSGEIRVPID
ncbi:restriction endonuclease subunit S [Asaccharospora irregularis]|uniref:Type I restriction enzyme, S subunit n=1 Tax=Asaccharospora irregularis DSM 2635 TaxID=1121321 RepID=A0A1M5JLF3_9FIRM|nr:restriction endonuclease subunit S [Asaccharospora irregularis]SHG40853.1 type I restriction enzyme, S subunit [Asaccharospora irregularis DSM 2635]